MDEFGPLNLQPHPGRQWAPVAAGKGDTTAPRRRRMRATYKRPNGVRHLMAGYDLSTDRLYGHIVPKKNRTAFLAFCRYLRSLHPPEVRIAIVLDNFSPHLSTKTDTRVGAWAEANNVELAYTPFYGSWLNRIEAQFTGFEAFIIANADTVMRRPNVELMAEIFPTVPHRTPLGENSTLLSIDKARRLLGYEPQHSWRNHV